MNEKKSSLAPDAVVMIRPAFFGYNHDTAITNVFQQPPDLDEGEIHRKALAEFDRMVDLLRAHDVEVYLFDDTKEPRKPDAVFPNNWFSFHPDGTVILYPMHAPIRRTERRKDILDEINRIFPVKRLLDYSEYEKEGIFLEGTGSLVMDYVNRIAYASISPRTSEILVRKVCNELSLQPVLFHAVDDHNRPVYHTNVVLTVAEKLSLICLDAVPDEEEQEILLTSLRDTGHRVIAISNTQMKSFAGNMMEVMTRHGKPLLIMSETAYRSLLPGQLDAITQLTEILTINVQTIERYGGGSVRCMMAGVFNQV
ncbi:MAG: arginine deiminase-related protein [Cyclobacteriaceae bacterium]|nr:arginine deiminase-related protein [Cyclobacteriaceae bacterium]MCX7637634.1 arginine deiminase-related protein [Cyclobacteriaceae bacterium]MDW8331694.1 arginine deiminase-related protein [Cyclobacteriaceae bacterium]